MKIYHIYYYAEGERVSLGYYINKEKASEENRKWSFHKYIDEIEVKE